MRSLFLAALLLITAGCAAVQPVSPGAPRSNQPAYPAVLTEALQRTDGASAVWVQITSAQGIAGKPEVPLQPITATIHSLPANLKGRLYLPKVGAAAEMSEEESLESLRRFLVDWRPLLGANPAQLSLVSYSTANDGVRTVVYEQRPFTYPLRGEYGKVEVRFTADRRILDVSSSAIPDSDKIQATLSAAANQLRDRKKEPKLEGRTVTYSDSSGTHTFTLSTDSQAATGQLVIYPRLTTNGPEPFLELHLAWEIYLKNSPVNAIYIDALQDEVITTRL